MRLSQTSDLWWKNAVVYCLDVQTFVDADGDGRGDLAGLTERIDHLAELGVTCLWLMPMYPTTDHDDGYDVTDYYGVDPRLGTHGELVEIVRTARDRAIRVIVDLVVNHTSTEHPWFRESRSSTDSPYRDYYVWRSDPPPDTSHLVFFPDEEDGIWELDDRTGEYYLHHFYRHQPDLNISNPRVREEIEKVLGFWLQLGVCGFRVDAVPRLLDTERLEEAYGNDVPDPHDYLRELAAFVQRREGEAMLMGEVNLAPEQQVDYVGEHGDQLTMVLDFPVMQQMFLALARQDARPLTDALRARPTLPEHCQWGTFLRNHDELTLDQLDDEERDEVFAAFGPAEEHQVFDRGLRRRLAPMLGGDARRLRMTHSLLFALPGTPVLFYGEEIGMGENLDLEGRMAVRSPMQWTDDDETGGFSSAAAEDLDRPVTRGRYGVPNVSVEQQRRDPESLLSFLSRLTRLYRRLPELGWSDVDVLDPGCAAVLAHRSRWHDRCVLTVHNLSEHEQTVRLQVADDDTTRLVDLLDDTGSSPGLDASGRLELQLEPYGVRWLRVVEPGPRPPLP